MEKITKYWAFLYLLGNIFAQYIKLGFLAQPTFYMLIAIGVVLLVMNIRVLSEQSMFRSHLFIYVFSFSLILYQFTLGLPYLNMKSITYLTAKVVCDFMFIISITKNAEFYERKFYLYLPILAVCLIGIGLFIGGVDIHSHRQTYGFGNSNAMCSIAALSAGCIFIQNQRLNKWHWIAIAICVYGVLMGGSRTSMVILIFGFIFKYGLRIKTLFIVGAMFLSVSLMDNMGMKFSGIERLTSTVQSGDYVDDRRSERKATIMMIEKNPIIGNGLYADNTGAAKKVSQLGSHNGYLDLIKFMGVLFGGFSIIILFVHVWRILKEFYSSKNLYIRTHLYIVISVLASAMYEAYIWGVNQMTNSFLFVSLAFLGYLLWLHSNGMEWEEEEIEDDEE